MINFNQIKYFKLSVRYPNISIVSGILSVVGIPPVPVLRINSAAHIVLQLKDF